MSDLTHEKDGSRCLVAHESGGPCYGCKHCFKFVRPANMDDPCPEHPGRQREEEDDLTHDVAISIAEDTLFCNYCDEEGVSSDDPCPEHPDRQREEGDELTHEFPAKLGTCIDKGGTHKECMTCTYCDSVIMPDDADDPCPARQPAEDDDDGEGDVKRRIAKEILLGDTSLAGATTVNKLNLYERAIREHCELSEGVCGWTWDDKHKVWESDCGESFEFWEDGPKENGFEGCHFCVRAIEITTDEGGEYEVGDLVEVVEVEGYDYIYEVSDDRYRTIGSDDKVWYPKEDFTKHADKIGSFAPDDDALERVNPEAKGELLVLGNKGVYLWPFIESGGAYVAWNEMGEAVNLQPHEVTRTGIVLESFHKIAEVSENE